MKIILLKDVAKVGKRFEIKDISDGHAVNMLIPRGLAITATPDTMKRMEIEKSKDEGQRKIHQELFLMNIKELEGVTVTMTEKANEKGHLFAGVHKAEIIPEVLRQTRLQLHEENINLNKSIKETGEHQIEVVGAGKSVKFTLKIVAA